MPETDPSLTPRCLKCGSDAMVPDALLLERTNEGRRRPVETVVQTRPDAWVLKGEVSQPTRAQVCGDCGFVELYAVDPHAIWDAHVDRTARELDS